MKALFGTAYFPPIAYIAALGRHREILIEVKETFPKQTYRNRMNIMTANGVRSLTVPVLRDNHSRTEEVAIDYRDRWNVIHLRTLAAAYAASPYYLYYKDDIESLLLHPYHYLTELNQDILLWLIGRLKLDCTISATTEWVAPGEICTEPLSDFRQVFSPKIPYPTDSFTSYYQVFPDRQPFAPNLSILDLLFNLGPEAKDYLNKLT
ncbi:MAG: WbqC family protein [Bacteroidales bacterium]|nr:WbqC family protein [Bacteroidales bacterium]MBR6844921.1 WbqC family protein [Bacteroidales bacterium]